MREVRGRTKLVHMICVLVVICMFAVSAMVLVNVGAMIYKNITENNLETFRLRTSLSYVKTKINQFDERGRITVDKKDGNNILILSEDVEGVAYDTVVYFYEGKLLETLHEAGAEYKLSDGFTILNIEKFEIVKDGSMIKMVATDKHGKSETMYVKLRSES